MSEKSIVVVVALLLTPGLQASCVERISQTQHDIEALLTEVIDADQRAVMTSLLLRLCDEREPGSSVVEQAGRKTITTHGLNEDPEVQQSGNVMILGVGVDERGCGATGCDRARNRP